MFENNGVASRYKLNVLITDLLAPCNVMQVRLFLDVAVKIVHTAP